MNTELFLKILLVISVITGLMTEAVKKQFDELGKKYYSNMLAGICAVFTGVLICIGYYVIYKATFDLQLIVSFVAVIIMSWIMAMVGYDKVVQALSQFKK